MEDKVLQIIDANLNRAREGLRVVEDVARFVLQDEKLTKEIKAARHKLSKLLEILPPPRRGQNDIWGTALIKVRDTTKDLGKYSDFDTCSYKDLREVVRSNLIRAQEGCRVIEEFSKLFSKELPPKVKEIRFKVYDIEKVVIQALNARL
ncbi:MAG: hypothetical protein QMD71_06935 [bacterium]|nr:hypothetical protein [bacterium]